MSDFALGDPKAIVESYIHANRDPVTVALTTFFGALDDFNLRALVYGIFNALSALSLGAFITTMLAWIMEHPFHTAFIVLGLTLNINPLAAAGFGALGPEAGTFAAAWQSRIGATIAKGSPFAHLQRLGMTRANTIETSGLVMITFVILAAAVEDNEAIRGALQDVGRWIDTEIGGRVGPVLEDAGRWVDKEIGGRVGPALEDAGRWINTEIGPRVGPALEDAGRWVDKEIGGRVGPVLEDAGRSLLHWWQKNVEGREQTEL